MNTITTFIKGNTKKLIAGVIVILALVFFFKGGSEVGVKNVTVSRADLVQVLAVDESRDSEAAAAFEAEQAEYEEAIKQAAAEAAAAQ